MISFKDLIKVNEGKKLECPECGSTDIAVTPNKTGYHCTCRDCGYEWNTDKNGSTLKKMGESVSVEINDGAKKYNKAFDGDIGTLIDTITKMTGYQSIGWWENTPELFEVFFEKNAQRAAAVKKLEANSIWNENGATIATNGRIMTLRFKKSKI